MGNSIYYLFVCAGSALFCVGVVFTLKTPFYNLSTAAVRQLDIILDSSLDEHEKDRLILKNLMQLLFHFFKLILLFALDIIGGVIPALIYVKLNSVENIDITSFYFYFSMLLGCCILFLFKREQSNYSYWSKLFHTIILDNYNFGKFLFEKDIRRNVKDKVEINQSFVIVTGLARAGTTALTNLLYDPNVFHSISYSAMPFLLAPNMWKKIYNPKPGKKKERAHGDNVLFNENSIEALDEYFFKVFCDEEYIHESFLDLNYVNKENYLSYLSYQQLFKEKQKDTIYIAKNNNFMLRYTSMRLHNQHFKLILIFRSPIEHAHSLLRQNRNFISQQTEDPFILKYMNWLGHYEFGLNQKVFNFGNENIWSEYSKDSLDYWIAIWINYHQYVLQFLSDENLYLVHYEDLLNSPDKLKEKLAVSMKVDVKIEAQEKFVRNIKLHDNTKVKSELLNNANSIYQKLLYKKVELN